MRHDASVVVDQGQYQDAVTPWEQEAWRDAALGWAERELAARGLRETGQRRVRLRPWSVLVRLAVEDHNAVWFKANPPGSAFEATLTSALAHWVPEHVLEPLAVDADHGWSLLPHGGELFRDVLNRSPADPRVWEELLGQEPAACMAGVPNGHLRKGVQDPEAEAGFAPEHVVSGGLEALCRYLAGNGVGLPVPTKMVIPPPRQ